MNIAFLAPPVAARFLMLAKLHVLGGKGSGNFGHSGRKGEVGGSAPSEGDIVYHGTKESLAGSILKKGLLSGKSHKYETDQREFLRQQGGHVYLAGTKETASTHDKGVIIGVRAPKGVEQDPIDKQSFRFKGSIEPSRIVSITPVRNEKVGKWSSRPVYGKTYTPEEYRKEFKGKVRGLARHPESAIHHVADRHFNPMMVAVMYAFMKGKQAYKSGVLGSRGAEKAAVDAVREALQKSLPPVLLKLVESGGQTTFDALKSGLALRRAASASVSGQGNTFSRVANSSPAVAGGSRTDDQPASADLRAAAPPFKMNFNVKDPKAVEWARKHAAELADDLSETSKKDIRKAVADALEGDGLGSTYGDILDAVGDEARAERIARTEIMWAANEGQQQGWEQAVENGLLPEDTQIRWIATAGCCDACDALDGETRDIDGEYEDSEAADGPPLHPNCRCTEGVAG